MDWGVRAALTGLLAWSIWATVEIYDGKRDVAIIQSNRFTATDGMSLYQSIMKEAPRPEVTQRLGRIEGDIKELDRKIDALYKLMLEK